MRYTKLLAVLLAIWALPSMAQVTTVNTSNGFGVKPYFVTTNFSSILDGGPQAGEVTTNHIDAMFAAMYRGGFRYWYQYQGNTRSTNCGNGINVIQLVSKCSPQGCQVLSDSNMCADGSWRIRIFKAAAGQASYVSYVNIAMDSPTQDPACIYVSPYTHGVGRSQLAVSQLIAREFLNLFDDGSARTNPYAITANDAYSATSTACKIRGWAMYAGSAGGTMNSLDLQPLANMQTYWSGGDIYTATTTLATPALLSNWTVDHLSAYQYGTGGPRGADRAFDATHKYFSRVTPSQPNLLGSYMTPSLSWNSNIVSAGGHMIVEEFGNSNSYPPTRLYGISGDCSTNSWGSPDAPLTNGSFIPGTWFTPGASSCPIASNYNVVSASTIPTEFGDVIIQLRNDRSIAWKPCSVGNWCVGPTSDYNGNLTLRNPNQLDVITFSAYQSNPGLGTFTHLPLTLGAAFDEITDRTLLNSGGTGLTCTGQRDFGSGLQDFCELIYTDATADRTLRTVQFVRRPFIPWGIGWDIKSQSVLPTPPSPVSMPASIASGVVNGGTHFSVVVILANDQHIYFSTRTNFGAWTAWTGIPSLDSQFNDFTIMTPPTITFIKDTLNQRWYMVFGGRYAYPV